MTKLTKETEDVVAEMIAKLRREKATRMYEGDYINPNGLAAADLIQSLSDRIDVLEGALRQIQTGADRGIADFCERQNGRRSPIWRSVNVLQDNLAACYGTALAALIKTDDSTVSLIKEGGR